MLSLPRVFKFYKCKGRPPPILQIYEDYLAILVEQVLNIFTSNVRGQIPHVYSALVA